MFPCQTSTSGSTSTPTQATYIAFHFGQCFGAKSSQNASNMATFEGILGLNWYSMWVQVFQVAYPCCRYIDIFRIVYAYLYIYRELYMHHIWWCNVDQFGLTKCTFTTSKVDFHPQEEKGTGKEERVRGLGKYWLGDVVFSFFYKRWHDLYDVIGG